MFAEGQPKGDLLGSQGPDQGFAIKLARSLEAQLELTKNEHASDVIAGCVAVALKRASAFGRADPSSEPSEQQQTGRPQ